MRRLAGLVLVLVAAALLPAVPVAQPAAAARVVAIGDVHGSVDGLRSILRATGLVDAGDHWTGGTATLVQTGDVTDRGAGVRPVIALLRRLTDEAPRSGGRVLALLGNHEVMNLLGELRDVTPEICASFADPDAAAAEQREGWRAYETLARERARRRPGEQPPGLARTEASWRAAYPPGCLAYRRALGPEGGDGRWLRGLPVAAKVGRTVFMHAGAPPDTTASIDEVNATARDEIARYDRFVARLSRARLIEPWFRLEDVLGVAAAEVRWVNGLIEQARARDREPDLDGVDLDLVKEAAGIVGLGQWSLLAAEGPLWYRGYATADDAALAEPLAGLLRRWDATRLVVGHTVASDFRVRARLGGTLFLIDTGMLASVYRGVASALTIQDDAVRAVYGDGSTVDLALAAAAPPPPVVR
ncbi:MAG: metallophosphoesterase [Vicinamibacterales bacterium]